MAATLMTYDDLLKLLPACPGAAKLPATGGESAPHYVPVAPSEFVAPNLLLRDDVEQPNAPSVFVVSAAGAVGKSTLAKAICHGKGAPLWDLAKYQTVGKSSLLGELINAFTPGQLPQVLADLAAGQLFLVIDALDEARLKVTESSFLDFLADIGNLVKSGAAVSFVLLGRTQIAELAWVILTDNKVPTSLLTVDFFDRGQANRYVELVVRRELHRQGKGGLDNYSARAARTPGFRGAAPSG